MTAMLRSLKMRSLLFFFGIAAVSSAILLAERWDDALRVAGVMAAMFIVYELLAARNHEKIGRIENSEALKDVNSLVSQCISIVGIMYGMLDPNKAQELNRALDCLSTKTTILVTHYRKYFDPDTAYLIKETEHVIVVNQLSKPADLGQMVAILDLRLRRIGLGIRDIDDPFLHASRRGI